MITKEQALTENHFHFGTCWRNLGPRDGITDRSENWRGNGMCKTWKTRPNDFRKPIKFGLYCFSYLTQDNADDFHLEKDCPLKNPNLYGNKDNPIIKDRYDHHNHYANIYCPD